MTTAKVMSDAHIYSLLYHTWHREGQKKTGKFQALRLTMHNNNNNNPICKAPECQKTSVAHGLGGFVL